MKKLMILVMMAFMVVSIVSASDSYISEDELSMAYNDVRVVEYCISNAGGQQNIDVVITETCKDVNSVYGCQPGDASAAGLFAVSANPTVMNDGECVDITLTTTVADPADGGQFYYTINGQVGNANIGTEETGSVLVPEMGVLAAMGVLGAAGLFLYRKRH